MCDRKKPLCRSWDALLAKNEGLKAALKDMQAQLDNSAIAMADLHRQLDVSQRYSLHSSACK